MAELVYPAPVKRCKDKRTGNFYNIEDVGFADLIAKIEEELNEVKDADNLADTVLWVTGDDEDEIYKMCVKRTAEETADTITACITLLEMLGYDVEKRSKLFAEINAKNKARGYLD